MQSNKYCNIVKYRILYHTSNVHTYKIIVLFRTHIDPEITKWPQFVQALTTAIIAVCVSSSKSLFFKFIIINLTTKLVNLIVESIHSNCLSTSNCMELLTNFIHHYETLKKFESKLENNIDFTAFK